MTKKSKTTQDGARLFIDIPYASLRKLLLWAASRGDTKNSWARTILVLRCDENFPKVEAWLQNESKNLGVAQSDLETKLLERMGFNFEAYRIEMLGTETKE